MKTFSIIIEYTARLLNGSFWYGSLTRQFENLNKVERLDRLGYPMGTISMKKALFYRDLAELEEKRNSLIGGGMSGLQPGWRSIIEDSEILNAFNFAKLDCEEMLACNKEDVHKVKGLTAELGSLFVSEEISKANSKAKSARTWMVLGWIWVLICVLTWKIVSSGKVDVWVLYVSCVVLIGVLGMFLNEYIIYVKMVVKLPQWIDGLVARSKDVHSVLMQEVSSLKRLQEKRNVIEEVDKLGKVANLGLSMKPRERATAL